MLPLFRNFHHVYRFNEDITRAHTDLVRHTTCNDPCSFAFGTISAHDYVGVPVGGPGAQYLQFSG
jgi:hypothetical protein